MTVDGRTYFLISPGDAFSVCFRAKPSVVSLFVDGSDLGSFVCLGSDSIIPGFPANDGFREFTALNSRRVNPNGVEQSESEIGR